MRPRAPRPPRLARWLLRLRPLGSRRAEVIADLDEVFAERVADGGRRRASRRYYRDVISLFAWNLSGTRLVGDALQDLSHGLRVFRRNPAGVAITVLGLSLAIAVSTAVFTVLNTTILRPTGVSDPGSTVRVMRAFKNGVSTGWPYADYQALRDNAAMLVEASMTDTARFSSSPGTPANGGDSVQLSFVGEGYLRGFGARPAHGRILEPADDTLGAPPTAVVSYGFWARRLASDPAVVGRQVWLNGTAVTIVGIAPRTFTGVTDQPPAFWTPFASYHLLYSGSPMTRTSRVNVNVSGRVPQGMTRPQAEAALSAIAVAAATPEPGAGLTAGVQLEPAGSRLAQSRGGKLAFVVTLVLAAVGLVVLLACVNVANLQLASATARQREIGVRLALGAARTRIVRQLVTESLALGLTAGVLGLLLATWLGPALAAVVNLPVTVDVTPDLRVYIFLAVISVSAGIGAGLAPARHGTRGDLLTPLKDGGASTGGARSSRTRAALIGVQAAASVVLLVLAALLTRATLRATQVDVGFDAGRLIAIAPDFTRERYDAAKSREYWMLALERLRVVPGVESAALALFSPYGGGRAVTNLVRDGVRYQTYSNDTTPEFFVTLGLRMVRGRAYTQAEADARAPVVVISETLARAFWPGQDPIGQSLAPFDGSADTIVGIVSDAITARLRDRSAAALYRPLRRAEAARVVIRTAGPPEAVLPAIRDAVQSLDPRVRLDINLAATGLREQLEEPRIMATLAGALATLALALAAVGIYGVTAFVTGQRTREIGLRIAVGASRADVLRLLLKDSLRPVAIGLAAGAAIALLLGRMIAGILYGIGGHDPVAFAMAAGFLLISAAGAAFVPAWRASRVDPAFVLRQS